MLDLSHGFWVLLTILTVLRASAAATRSALKPALIGTVAGSVGAAGLLLAGVDPRTYVIALPLVMVVGFAAGPLIGLGWGQAMFTLVIAMVFAQVAPVDWRLPRTACWTSCWARPSGCSSGCSPGRAAAAGELHRAAGNFLADAAGVVRETVAVVPATGGRAASCPGPGTAGWPRRLLALSGEGPRPPRSTGRPP